MNTLNLNQELAILIPTLNEEAAIGNLVERCKTVSENVVVIDGLSSDKTIEIAKKSGAEIVICKEKGKGTALIQGFNFILDNKDVSHLAYLDGDNTYDPEDIKCLYQEIQKDEEYGLIIGNRFPKREKGTITFINMIGNKFFSIIISFLAKQKITDTQTGLRILSRKAVETLSPILESRYFEIETEMIMKTAKQGFKIGEIPISYKLRDGETKLNPIVDGFRILRTIFKNIGKKK